MNDEKCGYTQFSSTVGVSMEFERRFYLDRLVQRKHNGLIKVITGLRRSGKSYLLFRLFFRHLRESGVDEQHIIRVVLDDRRYAHLCNPDAFLAHIDSCITDSGMYYVLLDEVQMMDEFESVLNTLLHYPNVDTYVTGSNSRFLSKDIITEFRGRGDEIHVYPLSFSEFMAVYPGDKASGFREYCMFGGLPQAVLEKTYADKTGYLKRLFEETYETDVVSRNRLADKHLLSLILDVVSSSVGSLTNPQRIANTFRSVLKENISRNTVSRYLDALEDAYLIRKVSRYDVRGRQYIGSPQKYYYEDVGLRNARLNFRQVEDTYLMENVVYLELCRRGYNVDVGIVEVNGTGAGGKSVRNRYEIDFVANLGSARLYIQSAYAVPDAGKLQQELRSLQLTGDGFRKILIVHDPVVAHYTETGVLVVGIYDFLLRETDLEIA
ncbi:MAG TPA: ATP-binding protein [Methanocorpusculum sp.]|nr:ATP-binding protein [Methanocorpusculum sp.]